MPRPQRKSGGLGAELRGDTGAALSTLEPTPTFTLPSLSPVNNPCPHSPGEDVLTHQSLAQLSNQSYPHTFQTSKSPQSLPPMERPFIPPHMGQPSNLDPPSYLRLSSQPFTHQPAPQRHLPLLPPSSIPPFNPPFCSPGPFRHNILWQRPP